MKVLITGGSSLLDKYLTATKPDNIQLESTWYTNFIEGVTSHHLNVVNQSQVDYVFANVKPDLVIHCAAIGDVEQAESEYRRVFQTNVTGTINVVSAAVRHKAKVIYISSNAVFSGNNAPYAEDDIRNPVNNYGKIKRQAERVLLEYRQLNWLIIRPFMLYGWPYDGGRSNWGATITNSLSEKKSIKLVNDVVWQPTYAEDAARAIWELIEIGGNREIYHVAASERNTLHMFGLKIAQVYGFDTNLIEPVPSSYFPTIAKRPKDTTYKLDKITALGIELDGVEDGIKRMKNEGFHGMEEEKKDQEAN